MKDFEKINEFLGLGVIYFLDEFFNYQTLLLWFFPAIILFVFDVLKSIKRKNNLDVENENREISVFQLFYTIVMHFTFHGGVSGLLFLVVIWHWFCLFCLLLSQNTPLFEYIWEIANIPRVYVVICIATLVSALYVSTYHKGQIIK